MIPLGAFWNRNGVLFVQANAAAIGPTESLPFLKQQGCWVAFNIASGDWPDERRIASGIGLDWCVWRRVASSADLTLLRAAGKWTGCKAIIPDVEIADTRNFLLMQQIAYALSAKGRGFISSDGWIDPIGQWQPVRRWVLSPQCYVEQDPKFHDLAGCVSHAESLSTRQAIPTLGVFPHADGTPTSRSDYPAWTGPRILYPGDQIASIAEYRSWFT